MPIYAYILLYMAIYGHIWLYMDIYVTIYDWLEPIDCRVIRHGSCSISHSGMVVSGVEQGLPDIEGQSSHHLEVDHACHGWCCDGKYGYAIKFHTGPIGNIYYRKFNICPYMPIYCYIWLYMGIYGYIWTYMSLYMIDWSRLTVEWSGMAVAVSPIRGWWSVVSSKAYLTSKASRRTTWKWIMPAMAGVAMVNMATLLNFTQGL